MNDYYTHQKYLIRTLNLFDYEKTINCLEFGTGEGSSSVFCDFARKYKNINIESFEHENNWFKTMKSKYSLENYKFNLIDWSTFNYDNLKDKIYDLIFVDQGSWDARIDTIDNMKDNAKYIILHDYCYYQGFNGSTMEPSSDMKENRIEPGSFFYEKYFDEFEIIPETDLYPPTLILKSKKNI